MVINEDTVKIPMHNPVWIGYHERRDWLEKHNIRYFDWQEDGYDIFKFINPRDATFFRLVWS
jgi:hypothetical protein